ncbi:hypothetical protein AFLA_011627 [Aspergillus flavus NRRL3357]|nr:hypothetical protein AFLA_011627 [Aspergillus flavus NRRL3357]
MPRKKIDVWGLWASARSPASSQRYHGAKGNDPDNAEQSIAFASKVTTREIVTINDPTLGMPFLDEAAIGDNSNSNSSANAVEDRSSQNRRPTWIRGVYLCANATVGLLLLNTIFISVVGGLASKHRGSGGSSNSKVVYEGSCVITSRWNTAFHFIINAISTCILAASNYCMQTLIAPTRDEIDLFHAKRRWLDIGVTVCPQSLASAIMQPALMKVFAMYLAAHLQRSRAPPLLTTGDAVASFLERPDDTTKGMCWASKRHIRKGTSRQYRHLSPPRQWRKASSPFHWLATSMIFVGCSVVAIGLLAVRLPSAVANPQGLWDYESNVKGTGAFVLGTVSEMQGVVTANSVQLLVTVGYYFYNSVLTSMLASAEYSSYGTDRKPLRVTWPVKGSQQRSTYWLSVPYKYGIPVMILFMVIHWFVSQALYYVLLIPYSPDDQPLYGEKFSSLGASVLPMFIAGLVGLVLFILLLCLAFRRLKSTILLAGSCSAAISAACHPPEDVCNATAAHGELLWGETSLPRDCVDDQSDGCDLPRGHCSFTPLDARQPSLNKLYA